MAHTSFAHYPGKSSVSNCGTVVGLSDVDNKQYDCSRSSSFTFTGFDVTGFLAGFRLIKFGLLFVCFLLMS